MVFFRCTAVPSRAAGSNSGGKSSTPMVLTIIVSAFLGLLFILPLLWRFFWFQLGQHLRRLTASTRQALVQLSQADEEAYEKERQRQHKSDSAISGKGKSRNNVNSNNNNNSDDDWNKVENQALETAGIGEVGRDDWHGIVGFFHPFCNAGGGGERVLWAAIRAVQQRWPKARCVVYTGDIGVNKNSILSRVKDRFNIHLYPPTINFLYLSARRWVLASTWPHFTLAGQSLGSILLAWDAFSLLVPDIFIDTMGYAFALGFSKLLFPGMPTGAYVHYPTISADMLASLDATSPLGCQGANAGQGVGLRGAIKRVYWQVFARAYSQVGSSVDVVMTNSSWTQGHMQKLWGPLRERRLQRQGQQLRQRCHGEEVNVNEKNAGITVVYPPVAVRELEQEIDVSAASEDHRERVIVYLAQFRPEKNHALILQAFAAYRKSGGDSRLVLIGSVRDDADSKRVYQLRLLVNELHIRDAVEFHLDAPWAEILGWLRRASVGVNGMWNEHFGIGVVEYQAAGLIAVVHDSGGPKLDIVTCMADTDSGLSQPTGFHATSVDEFAAAFTQVLALPPSVAYHWRQRARRSARRFSEEAFTDKWIAQVEKLIKMVKKNI